MNSALAISFLGELGAWVVQIAFILVFFGL